MTCTCGTITRPIYAGLDLATDDASLFSKAPLTVRDRDGDEVIHRFNGSPCHIAAHPEPYVKKP